MMEKPKTSELNIFLLIIFLLVVFGILMVYSSSYIYAKENFGTSNYFLIKHIQHLLIGLGLFVVVSKIPTSFWLKNAIIINIACTIVLFLTLIPDLGVSSKGSSRWLNLRFFSIQPGEFIKYTILLFSINYFESFFKIANKERIINTICLIVPLLFLLKQPDFGTFTICLAIILFICFMSSFPRGYFYSMLIAFFSLLFVVVWFAPYRVQRMLTFLDPWKDPRKNGFQIIQSYLGFANGGFWGEGIGNSNEKLFYLPEAHNDFIFSVVGEEFGFIGVIGIVILFLLFCYFGLKLSLKTVSYVDNLLVAGIVFLISFQASLNMGVVLGLLPTKGLNLPFVSSGGSSLIANFIGLGILYSAINGTSKFRNIFKSTSPHPSYSTRF